MKCPTCGTQIKPTNWICGNCQKDYWQLIYRLGHEQLPALHSLSLKQARIGRRQHTPSNGYAPLPLDQHALDLIDTSSQWLAETAGKINTAYANLKWDKAWKRILANRHTIINMPTIDDDYRALQRIIRRNNQALTPAEDMILIGTCPHCSRQLQAPPDALTASCTCGGEWPVPAIKAARDRKLWELEYTGKAADAARYLQKFGIQINSHRINVWLDRGKLHHAKPTTHKGEYTFNLGELTGLLA